MQSLLKRWLHKCRWPTSLLKHSHICKDARKHLEPAVIPTRYICEELTSEFANYWTQIQDHNGEGLQQTQLDALTCWHAFQFKFGRCTEQYPLPLDLFVGIFDDHFFLGALRQYTIVEWVDVQPANSAWAGITKRNRKVLSSEPPEIRIQVKRLPGRLWTHELVQEYLDTLLHEMTHAFLMIYSAPADTLGGYRRVLETEGLTGHGPCWVKFATAVAAEADRSLGGLWGKWDLGISDAYLSEREAWEEFHDRKGLIMVEEVPE